MAAGGVTVLGPYSPGDTSAIDTAITAKVTGAATETLICWTDANRSVYFLHVEGA